MPASVQPSPPKPPYADYVVKALDLLRERPISGLGVVLIFLGSFLYHESSKIPFVVIGLLCILIDILVWMRQQKSTERNTSSTLDNIRSNLPRRKKFAGREEDKKRVLEGLRKHSLVVIQGPAGIGKTALAIEIGWSLKKREAIKADDAPDFEAVIWAEDHGGDLTLDRLLDTILEVLGSSDVGMLSLANKQLEIIKWLQDRRCLIIIDNFETVSDPKVESFVQKAPSSVIIVSRKKISLGGWVVELDKMNFKDRMDLARIEAERLGIKPPDGQNLETVLEQAFRLTDGDPYSVRMRIAQMQAGIPFQDVQRPIYDDDQRLQPIWDFLQDRQSAIKVIAAISMFQSPPALEDIERVSKVTGVALHDSLKLLDEFFLVDVHNEATVRRYSLHSRTKAFVTKKLNGDVDLAHPIYESLANWVEEYVYKHGDKHRGLRNWSGYPTLDQQYATIMVAVEWCSQQKSKSEQRRVIAIWRAIDYYMNVRGNLDDYLRLGERVQKCAKALGDLDTEIEVGVEVLAFTRIISTNRNELVERKKEAALNEAETLIQRWMESHRNPSNLAEIDAMSRYLRYLGMIAQRRGDYKSARVYFEKSLKYLESGLYWGNLGAIFNSLGTLAREQGDSESAKEYYSRRLTLAKAVRNPEGIAVASYNLGRLAQKEGKYERAVDFYEQALKAGRESHRGDIIAASQWRWAQCLKHKGNISEAAKLAKDAQRDYEMIGNTPRELLELSEELNMLQSKPLRGRIMRVKQMLVNVTRLSHNTHR